MLELNRHTLIPAAVSAILCFGFNTAHTPAIQRPADSAAITRSGYSAIAPAKNTQAGKLSKGGSPAVENIPVDFPGWKSATLFGLRASLCTRESPCLSA